MYLRIISELEQGFEIFSEVGAGRQGLRPVFFVCLFLYLFFSQGTYTQDCQREEKLPYS